MKNIPVIAVIILVISAGSIAFFGGMKFQEGRRINLAGQFGNHNGEGGQGRSRGAGGRPVSGEIINAGDKSITVKLSDGSSKIILISDSTSVNIATQGAKNDLKTGERVFVTGQTNSDGSVTAQNIQLNPAFRQDASRPQQ